MCARASRSKPAGGANHTYIMGAHVTRSAKMWKPHGRSSNATRHDTRFAKTWAPHGRPPNAQKSSVGRISTDSSSNIVERSQHKLMRVASGILCCEVDEKRNEQMSCMRIRDVSPTFSGGVPSSLWTRKYSTIHWILSACGKSSLSNEETSTRLHLEW